MDDAPPPPPLTLAPAAAHADTNTHRLVARYRKARKISNHLVMLQGADVASVENLGTSELGRTLAAQAAGVNVPSEMTWALVVEMVRESYPFAAR